jgi:hypothetical protein
MKLPNFYSSDPLNSLKERMGLGRDVFGDLNVSVNPARLTAAELERLTSQDGLDISLGDLKVLDDGTLAYKDSRVLLYIRDVTVYGDRETEPRYHLASCSTLKTMRERQRFNRYVVSTRTDGAFKLNCINGAAAVQKVIQLSVCQNCLGLLSFNGFRMEWQRPRRRKAVQSFTLGEFFQKYPKSLHAETPRYNSETAPLNNYTADFSEISESRKVAAQFRCQGCGYDCSSKLFRKFLHSHHIDGDKANNSYANLKVLCLSCHAGEHPHMKAMPDFHEFQRMKAGFVRRDDPDLHV